MFVAASPRWVNSHCSPIERPAPLVPDRVDRDRLGAAVLDLGHHVVLQVLADAGQVRDHRDAERGELGGVADAGELQQLRGVERAAGQHDPACLDLDPPPGPVLVADARDALAVEQQLRGEAARADLQVGPPLGRVQEGARHRQPPAAVDRALPGGEALRLRAVDVRGEREARLLRGLEERLEQRVGDRAALEQLRAVVAAHRAGLADVAGLQPLEVGEAVRVVPGRHALFGTPPVVVRRVAALEDHRVDAARAAEQLAPRMRDAPAVQEGLRLGLVAPVVEAAPDGHAERRGHLDGEVPPVVRAARLQQQHAVGRVGAEPVRQDGSCRSGADDHEVVLVPHHG